MGASTLRVLDVLQRLGPMRPRELLTHLPEITSARQLKTKVLSNMKAQRLIRVVNVEKEGSAKGDMERKWAIKLSSPLNNPAKPSSTVESGARKILSKK